MRKCKYCTSKKIAYNKKYDAYYCNGCREWQCSKCGDNNCEFCANRPNIADITNEV